MKKLATLICVLAISIISQAQNYFHMNITEIEPEIYGFCESEYDGIIIAKDPDCSSFAWTVQAFPSGESYYYTTDEITVTPNMGNRFQINYNDNCTIHSRLFVIEFHNFQVTEPWSQDFIWKRTGTNVTLEAPYGDDLEYQWSNGSHQRTITVTQPGSYWVRIYNDCGELYDTIQVRDNAEITLATCDLETNHNMITWSTTPAQAEYVSQVEIKRDGMVVGAVDYAAGSFIDNIGSDAASRTYTIKAIDTEGVSCPITSYPKETIHMAYLTGINNTIEVNWNTPTGYNLMGYNICEWHEDDGSLSVIDYVGSSVTSYTCSQSQFDQGYIVVQGVEASKDGETRLLSNRSLDLVGLGENEAVTFKVYPNPAKDSFIVEGSGTMTITNALGQTIMTREIDGKTTIELPQGMYFVKLGDAMRKVVVE